MVTIREVKSEERKLINDIVTIHLSTFTGFFLTFMGRGFLNQMYRSYCAHPESGLLVAEDQGKAIGFLAYSGDFSGLYKFMIRTRIIQFGWYSVGAFFRRPSAFMRILRAFLKPSETVRTERYVELSSIGVAPVMKSKGVGTMLVITLIKNTDFDRFQYIKLETDAQENDRANHFYQKNGFSLQRTFKTHEGRLMNEYRLYRGSNEKNLVH